MGILKLDKNSIQLRIVPNCHPDEGIWCCIAHGKLYISCEKCDTDLLVVDVSEADLDWVESKAESEKKPKPKVPPDWLQSWQQQDEQGDEQGTDAEPVDVRSLARTPEVQDKFEKAFQLLKGDTGASIPEIAQACSWAESTTRANLSTMRRHFEISHSKNGAEDRYRLVVP